MFVIFGSAVCRSFKARLRKSFSILGLYSGFVPTLGSLWFFCAASKASGVHTETPRSRILQFYLI